VDVVGASDILGFDTYQRNELFPNTNPVNIMEVIQYWIDNYSAGKPVFLCETGFTSVLTETPDGDFEVKKHFGTDMIFWGKFNKIIE
jgi:hypothetical protein